MHQLLSIPLTFRWLITAGFVALIVVLSITPGESRYGDNAFVWLVAHTPSLVQNAMHIVCYALVTALVVWSLEPVGSLAPRMLLALLLALALGIALEWYQTMVPGRFGTIVDVGLNAIGAALGLLAVIFLL